MQVIETVKVIQKELAVLRSQKKSIGFVPTMGALHQGHLSLIERAKKENDIVVVSIFVNPTQFNNPDDLKNYPRTLQKDVSLLENLNCDFVFAPSVDEMYPEKDTRVFEFGNLDKVMEGLHRPGHFNGVAQVVSKLFDIVQPNRAYFGEKDFQQVAIIRYLTYKIMKLSDLEIVSCPIVREKSGLALSSRNTLLTEEERPHAVHISKTLFKAYTLTEIMTVKELKKWVINQINADPLLKVEYFEIVDADSLQSVDSWEDANQIFGCITVFIGKVRLIDNIRFF